MTAEQSANLILIIALMKKTASFPYRTINSLALMWTAYKKAVGYRPGVPPVIPPRFQSTVLPSARSGSAAKAHQ